jgi:hypothetical protein
MTDDRMRAATPSLTALTLGVRQSCFTASGARFGRGFFVRTGFEEQLAGVHATQEEERALPAARERSLRARAALRQRHLWRVWVL